MVPAGVPGSDKDTVRRLLEAAAHEFAQHGYAAARIREIVDVAGANLAAVNYHFGGKEGLYRETVRMLARRSREEVPGEGPELRALPPQEQLRAFTRVMLSRFLGGRDASPMSRVFAHELLDPTPAFETLLREVVGPQYTRLEGIVSDLLGPRANVQDIAFASFSIVGQWAFFLFGRRGFEQLCPDVAGDGALLERLTDRICAFSLAGLQARRDELEAVASSGGRLRRGSPAKAAAGKVAPAPAGRRRAAKRPGAAK